MATSVQEGRNLDLGSALQEAEQSFLAANPKSAARHQEACEHMPGGNTRSVLHYAPLPMAIARGEGCRIWSLDGREYIDFQGEYSAGLYGHSNPVVAKAIKGALDEGLVLGAPNLYEAKLAGELCRRFPSLERVRFCNSGSEADLMSLSLARAVTGRSKVIAFHEAYHGGFLIFGHGGSPLNAPIDFVMAHYNDIEGTRALIREAGDQLAAVIIEPMIGAGGCIPAKTAFLEMLREETSAGGALLIFDEVITSRLSPGGLQAKTGVIPDITALGKYLGGGLTFGAFGGRADLMDRFDPSRPDAFMHAGTFNNNVLTMCAGYTGLSQILTEEALNGLNANGDHLRQEMTNLIKRHGLAASVTGEGSILSIHFVAGPVEKPEDIESEDPRLKRLFHLDMLSRGFYLTARGMMPLSLPLGEREYRGFLEALEGFFVDYGALLPKA